MVIGGMLCIGEVGVGLQEFVEGEGAALKSLSRCNCLVHKHLNMKKSSNGEHDLLLTGLLVYTVENCGRMYSGNIAVDLTKFMPKKGGYQSAQVAMEAKSAVSSDHSTHTQF